MGHTQTWYSSPKHQHGHQRFFSKPSRGWGPSWIFQGFKQPIKINRFKQIQLLAFLFDCYWVGGSPNKTRWFPGEEAHPVQGRLYGAIGGHCRLGPFFVGMLVAHLRGTTNRWIFSAVWRILWLATFPKVLVDKQKVYRTVVNQHSWVTGSIYFFLFSRSKCGPFKNDILIRSSGKLTQRVSENERKSQGCTAKVKTRVVTGALDSYRYAPVN